MNDFQTVNVLKGLVIDGVDKAKSGHPGGAMSSMDFAYLLFREYLKYDPDNAKWLGRDRFVLSAGHESNGEGTSSCCGAHHCFCCSSCAEVVKFELAFDARSAFIAPTLQPRPADFSAPNASPPPRF